MIAVTKERRPALATLGVPLTFAPMEARLIGELPKGEDWQFEPKWDGFRCLAFRAGDEVEIKAQVRQVAFTFFPGGAGQPPSANRECCIRQHCPS